MAGRFFCSCCAIERKQRGAAMKATLDIRLLVFTASLLSALFLTVVPAYSDIFDFCVRNEAGSTIKVKKLAGILCADSDWVTIAPANSWQSSTNCAYYLKIAYPNNVEIERYIGRQDRCIIVHEISGGNAFYADDFSCSPDSYCRLP